MSGDLKNGSAERTPAPHQLRLLLVGLAIGAVLFAVAWIMLPTWSFLAKPVAPDVRAEVRQAVEEATDPAEQANLRIELGRLEQEDGRREGDLRAIVTQLGAAALGGTAALWGAWTAWRQAQGTRESELSLAEHRFLTDTFTRAIDQLSAEQVDVRIGGIYTLERFARDSAADRPTVVETLAAFVRAHSVAESMGPLNEEGLPARPPPDVQAALTVLGRIERDLGSAVVDLSSAYLPGSDLRGANLGGANLARADLDSASLRGANLRDADLRDANLSRANLRDANLRGANLRDANLRDANLSDANLSRANLRGANLRGASLDAADLTDAEADANTRWPDGFDSNGA